MAAKRKRKVTAGTAPKLRKSPKRVAAADKQSVGKVKVRTGTPNELGPPRSYVTEASAQDAMIAFIDDYVPWCQRHNAAGIEPLAAARHSASEAVFHATPQRIECLFDEHYGMTIAVEYWKEST